MENTQELDNLLKNALNESIEPNSKRICVNDYYDSSHSEVDDILKAVKYDSESPSKSSFTDSSKSCQIYKGKWNQSICDSDGYSKEVNNLSEDISRSSENNEDNIKSYTQYDESSQYFNSHSPDLTNYGIEEMTVSENGISKSCENVEILIKSDGTEETSEKIFSIKSDSKDNIINTNVEKIYDNSKNKGILEGTEMFSWEDYLTRTDAEVVTATAFPHIEDSLATGVETGHCAEILLCGKYDQEQLEAEKQSYWIVEVVSAHDSLLRLKYLNIDVKCLPEFWVSLFDKKLHTLGTFKDTGLLLPPLTLPTSLSKDENSKLVESTLCLLPTLKSISAEALCEDTSRNYSRIRKGTILEVMARDKPFCGWFAKVVQNIGGRLQLEYISHLVENTGFILWLFYTDKRIKQIGWIQDSGQKYRYEPPPELVLDGHSVTSDWIQNLKRKSISVPIGFGESNEITKHRTSLGDTLAYVNPKRHGFINEVTVSEIHDEFCFSVTCDEFTVPTSFDDWLLLPTSFCESYSVSVSSLDEIGSISDVVENCMKTKSNERQLLSSMLSVGAKLEAVHPNNVEIICVATINRVAGHLMWLKLDSEPDFPTFIRTLQSTDIFAAEWASDNHHSFLAHSCKRQMTEDVPSTQIDVNCVQDKSVWCPAIYVNPWCKTGPLINKKKLVNIPLSVGPGSVKLVLLRILTFLFNSGYRPNRVLTDVDALLEKKRYWPHIYVKARYKQRIFRTKLYIPPFFSMVKSFLGEVCKILDCCPNLWTFSSAGENCPYGCPKKSSYMDNIYSFTDKIFSKSPRQRKILLCSDKQIERSPEAVEDGMDLDRESAESLSDGSDSSQTMTPIMDVARSPSPECNETKWENIRLLVENLDPNGLGVRDVETDPSKWSVQELGQYLSTQPDLGHLVPLLKKEDFDGAAFLLLDLPSILNELHIPYNYGIKLAHCVFRLKLACLIFDRDDSGQL